MNTDYQRSNTSAGEWADVLAKDGQHSSAEKRGGVGGFAVCSWLSLFGG